MRGTQAAKWIAVLVTTCVASAASAEKLYEKDAMKLNLGALLQPQALVAEGTAPDGNAGTDFFLRRARVLLYGDVTEWLSFFVDTEQANLGKDGDWTTSIFVQDAFASFRVAEDVYVDAGMMLLPFTRHSLQSAVSLNGLDYHAGLIKYPAGSQRIWRDAGAEVRATFNKMVQVRVGAFNGVEGVAGKEADMMAGTPAVMERNVGDLPRVAAHARVAILGEEKGFFFPGISFAKDPVVSVGVGTDYQHDAIGVTPMEAHDHLGLAADAYAEVPVAPDQEVVAQATFVRYDDGPGVTSTGMGAFVEAGFRILQFEPLVSADFFNSEVDTADLLGLHVGGNIFIDKHRANVKLDLARVKTGETAALSAALQAQFSF